MGALEPLNNLVVGALFGLRQEECRLKEDESRLIHIDT